nr:lysophospholipase [Rubrivivax sp.]
VLHALHLRLPSPDGVVFHLHGNAGHVGSWFTRADFYRRLNVDLFMVDYRGFGKSSGRIESEYDLHADIRAAWAHVAPAYAGRCRIVFGRSLGTGLAVQLAAEVRPDLTVLVSPYESLARLADEQYPWVPGVLLRYPMRTDLALPRVDTPVWMVHGARDRLIPPGHSASLQAIAPQAERLLLPDAGHEDVHRHPAYDEALAAVLRRTLSSSCRRSCRPRRRARG